MAIIKGKHVLVYDLEVFKKDYMAVLKDSETGEYYIFHNEVEEGKHYDRELNYLGACNSLYSFVNEYWLCGYNNYGYDNIILTAMIKNPNPSNVKFRNDALFRHMKENNDYNRTKPPHAKRRFTDSKRFPVFRSIKSIDAMQEIVADEFKDNMMGVSLKYIEGNLGLNIHETPIAFDTPRKLTDEEVKEVIKYCINDVDVTEQVMNARWEGYFETKQYLVEKLDDWSFEFAMTMRTTTLTGHLLRNDNKYDFNGLLEDLYNRNLMLPSMYEYWKKGYVPGDPNDDGLTLEMFDNIIKYKWGGIHGVHKREKYFNNPNIWHIDVASMYPSIIIMLGILGEEVTKLYKSIRDSRVDDKHQAEEYKLLIDKLKEGIIDKDVKQKLEELQAEVDTLIAKADGAKLILNKLYGILGSATSKVSNIGGLNAICVYGQVAMYNIGKLVSPYGTIIQFNTDGIYFIPNDGITKDFIRECLEPWEKEFGLEMDIEDFTSVAQRDVNTYVARQANGKYKTKGEISSYKDDWPNMFKAWNASIVEKAVVKYVTEGISIHETVNAETDLRRFQYITKSTKAYRGVMNMDTGIEEEQNVNRFFVVHSGGALYQKVMPADPVKLEARIRGLETSISELNISLPQYLADKENKEKFPTKKALAAKWKTGPEKKIKNAQKTISTLQEQLDAIERGEDIVTYSKITGMPDVEGRTLLYNGDVRTDTDDLLFKIDRQHYIDAALELAGKFGV